MDDQAKYMTCIICPKGCQMEIQSISEEEIIVTGNACDKGAIYAKEEILHPVRTLTTTLKTNNPFHPRISVKTKMPIPKEKILPVMRILNEICVTSPVVIGDVLVQNILNLNVDVVATMTLKEGE